MNTLTFQDAIITQFQTKTLPGNAKNYATLSLRVEVTPEIAQELGCRRSVFDDNDRPVHFKGHQLDTQLWDARISMTSNGVAPLTFKANRTSGFSIFPGTGEDETPIVEMSINLKIVEGVPKVFTYFEKATNNPNVLTIEPAQGDLPGMEDQNAKGEDGPVEIESIIMSPSDAATRAPKGKQPVGSKAVKKTAPAPLPPKKNGGKKKEMVQ